MAAHVVLVQNQRERAAAMRGKALVFSALLLALDISSTSAQSLFEQRAKCQKYADEFFTDGKYNNEIRYIANFDIKLGNCYILTYTISNKNGFKFLYDAITKKELAYITFDEKLNPKDCSILADHNRNVWYKNEKCDIVVKYIAGKMKTER